MTNYVNRLMKCGYSKDRARAVCEDFARNLPFYELENFVLTKERENVDRVEPIASGCACRGLFCTGDCSAARC
jgi:hypothetical protein